MRSGAATRSGNEAGAERIRRRPGQGRSRGAGQAAAPMQDAPSGTTRRWIARQDGAARKTHQGRRDKDDATRTQQQGRSSRDARRQGRRDKDAAGTPDAKEDAARTRLKDDAPRTMQGRRTQHRHGRRAGQQQRTARKGRQARDGRARDRRPGNERRPLAHCARRGHVRPGDRAAGGRCGRRAALRRTSTAPAATVIEVFQRGSKT